MIPPERMKENETEETKRKNKAMDVTADMQQAIAICLEAFPKHYYRKEAGKKAKQMIVWLERLLEKQWIDPITGREEVK